MGIIQVQEAVARYERIVKQAAQDYEDILRAAEADLRGALVATDGPVPSDPNVVTMKRSDYEQLQVQLKKVAEFIEAHPEITT